jgi:hypothetical protein
MAERRVACPGCTQPLPRIALNAADLTSCPRCGASVQAFVFPALFSPLSSGSAGERLVLEDEASCFYHPKKRALVICRACGRFLCGLCDLEIDGEHRCPACLEREASRGNLEALENRRTLYDNIAFGLAVLPILTFWITPVTAPIAMYLALRHWKTPSSIIPRTKVRNVLAVLVAGSQIVGWGFVLFAFMT